MSTIDSQALLHEYVRDHSEVAFEKLVRRYIDLVFSVALRRVQGARPLAEDVAQIVFTDLARKAPSLSSTVMLGGWLHRHTCFVAASSVRGEQRRLERERQALEMTALNEPPDSDWKQIAPVLDEVINELEPTDRDAIVLRFFEQHDLRAIGAVLGASEDAAQKRVSRALEKLRVLLLKRGVTLSLAALGMIMATRAIEAAPTSLAASITKGALPAGAAAGFSAAALFKTAPASAFKLVSTAGALGLLLAALVFYQHASRSSTPPLPSAAIVTQNASASLTTPASAGSDPTSNLPNPAPASSNTFHLIIVAADSGKPVPAVQLDYRAWEADKFARKTLFATRFGVCDIEIPRATLTQLELTSRIDGFADTRLHWEQGSVRAIPSAYTLRLVRPVSIGGRVVDADGQPVAGAKVGFNHQDSPTTASSPEDHHFGWIQVSTDTNGNWRIERIAPEMLRLIYGSASHQDYVQSPLLFAGKDREAEEKLRASTFTFHLGRAVTIRGIVTDSEGTPIVGAKVLVGQRSVSGSRTAETRSDGAFVVSGCRPGKSPLTAEAEGFAATTVEVELSAEAEPFRLTLQRGRILILRLVDQAGQAVRKAHVWLDTMNQRPLNNPQYGKLPVQADFDGRKPDADGRLVWSNAPDMQLTFDISATGFMRTNGVEVRPDGEEHVIVLPPAVTVSGTVRDAASGQPIPQFKIVTGWPETNISDQTVHARWSPFDRDWLSGSDGRFRHAFEVPLIFGMPNPGYMLRFEAEGYAPCTSRAIRADEAEVHLEVSLRRATETIVSVLLPDNRPAVHADVGLAMPQAGLQLIPGGFSHQNVQNGATLLITDAAGNFRLPADDSITRILIAHPAGFGEVTPAALASDPIVHLEAWGRLEGTYLLGSQPATNRDLLFQYGEAHSDQVSTSFESYRVKTDAAGKFVFTQVPPGKHKLARLVPVGGGQWHEPIADVEIRAGETTTTTIGGTGYSLTARLRWPEGWKPKASQQIFASIQTPLPPALSALMAQAPQDAAVAAQVAQSPEAQEYARRARHFQAAIDADLQTVSAEQLPPGDYILLVSAMGDASVDQTSTAPIAAQISFTVPADPPSGTLDLGEMLLQKVAGAK